MKILIKHNNVNAILIIKNIYVVLYKNNIRKKWYTISFKIKQFFKLLGIHNTVKLLGY